VNGYSNGKVITVLPGFVRTKMTEDLVLPEKLMATPDEVAEDVYKAYRKSTQNIEVKNIVLFL